MASTIIDSLVVKLGLDSSDFNKGQKDVAGSLEDTKKSTDRLGDDISASGKKAAEFFSQIEKAAIKFFAVLTVGRGLSDFTRTVVGSGAQLARMSERLGTSADTLSRWQGAVRQSGGTGEGLLNTLQGLSGELTQIAINGQSSLIPMLGFLGVSLKKSNGEAKSALELMLDLGDAANAKIPDKAKRFNILQSMGLDEGSINLMMKGAAERDRLLSSQKAYSDADAQAALKAQEKWEGVKLQIERTSQALVIKLLPLLEKISANMLKFAEIAVPVLLQVGDAFGVLHDKTDGWSTALIGVLATLRIIGGAGILGGITKLGGALSLLAIGGAGYAGVKAGEQINENLSEGIKDKIGEMIAKALAFFGNKEAAEAVRNNSNGYADFVPAAHSLAPGATQPPSTQSSAQSGASRSQRNNNPGNLEFANQRGATRENGEGRFARFETAAEGVAAYARQLQLDSSRGFDTVRELITKYSPKNENNTAKYIDTMAKYLGVKVDDALDLSDPSTLATFTKGVSIHEGGNWLSNADIMSGINMSSGSKGSGGAGNISIGEVKVYTQAQDANGIARDMRGAIIRQADTGIR